MASKTVAVKVGDRKGQIPEPVCAVCKEPYKQPRVLHCKHVCCLYCLPACLKGTKLTCPVCHTEKVFGKKSAVAEMPQPLDMSEQLEKIDKFLTRTFSATPNAKTCGICHDVSKLGTCFCLTCVKHLCGDCTSLHMKKAVFKNHALIPISNRTVCRHHKNEFVVGYCKTCSIGLCSICVGSGHKKHDVVGIKDGGLLKDKAGKLNQHKRETISSSKALSTYKGELKRAFLAMKKNCADMEKSLEEFRKKVNAAIDVLHLGLRQQLTTEQKKVDLHEADITALLSKRDTLLWCIDDLLKKNSAADVVISADELSAIPTNTIPVLPQLTLPDMNNTKQLLDNLKNLINTWGLPIKVDKAALDMYKLDIKAPESKSRVTKSQSLSLPRKPLILIRGSEGGGSLGNTPRGGATSRVPGVGVAETWETAVEGFTCDVTWDKEKPGWWVRTYNELYKFGLKGNEIWRVGEGVFKGGGTLCMDTKRGLLVTTDDHDRGRLVCISKAGKLVKKIVVPRCRGEMSVTYCPHKDIYIVSDTNLQCLWFVDGDTGKVVKQAGMRGAGDSQLHCPRLVCHQAFNANTCHIIVTDRISNSDCFKVFTMEGEFVRKFGHNEVGVKKLEWPHGICVDHKGKIVVCDWKNERVVRYWWDGEEGFDVLLTKQDLKGEAPECAAISPDGRRLVVGMYNVVRGYSYQ